MVGMSVVKAAHKLNENRSVVESVESSQKVEVRDRIVDLPKNEKSKKQKSK